MKTGPMKHIDILFKLLLVLLLTTSVSISQDYLLGNGDIITVDVYEHPDLRRTVRISGDGLITLPLIGDIKAVNLSIKELSKKIESILADGYIIDPQVNIFIEEFRNRKATILGEIESPGLYELEGSTSLLELISKAGGLTEDASTEIIIHRKKTDRQLDDNKIRVNLYQLMEEGQVTQNVQIIDGDDIFVPSKKVFYVTGEVKKPDSYHYEESLTVIKALTMAGGVTDRAASNRIRIIRSDKDREMLIKGVKLDQLVQPNDVIIVPESYF